MKYKISLLTWISGAVVLLFWILAVTAPWVASDSKAKGIFPLIKFGPESIQTAEILAAPTTDHLFGTDYVGRDILARIIHGVRNSFFFSMAVVAFSLIVGTLLGGAMGFLGGGFDLILSRLLEVIGNFPIFLLQLTLLAFLPQTYGILFFVMVIVDWIPYCRFARAEFLKLRKQEFVQAAVAVGCSKWRIFFRHLLPNSLTPILTYIPFDMSATITILGALSFLGFGEPINVASLGELMMQAKEHFQEAWWLAVFPAAVLFVLTLSLALFGSALRDIFDPRSAS